MPSTTGPGLRELKQLSELVPSEGLAATTAAETTMPGEGTGA